MGHRSGVGVPGHGTAIPCGLIVNELITNSIKYAFPGQRQGTIGVEFKQTGERNRLVVSDDGVGMSTSRHEEPGSGSLGLNLVNSLSEQLDGDPVFSEINGTTFTLTFREYREAGAHGF